ncbi:hypothetical protein EAL2_808p07640 (plasmid) [Peptoclostridium acidaminophilum DSM 3953]|uniref:Uncharacterized protein n=1 Tax=Peptoclostridium acidaminophilum DSM 3953 TaxID=1286171 RepID=W8TQ98_PEPAC|nr:bifunctional diguanylate cyclase/phosphodiesterase [Peptoclostridium acidaminophilum]AHM58267.1 hypothetical protein EAL2_808p07640 [Peptoclostridium acidaminophilum DSM 3953]
MFSNIDRIDRIRLHLYFIEKLNLQVWLISTDNRYYGANKAHLNYIGLTKKDVEGKLIEEIFNKDVAIQCIKSSEEVINSKKTFIQTELVADGKGKMKSFEIIKTPVFNGENIDYIVCMAIDNVELVENKNKFIISNQQYIDIVEGSSEMICKFLPDTTLTYVNQTYCDNFGKSRNELLGQSFLTLVPESEHEKIREYIASFTVENDIITYEHKTINSDGYIAWQRWTDRAFFDTNKNIIEFQSVGSDITDIKTENEKLSYTLAQNEERFKRLIGDSSEIFIIMDTDNMVRYVSPSSMEIIGRKPCELIGRNFYKLLHPDDRKMAIEIFLKICTDSKLRHKMQCRVLHSTGKYIDLEISFRNLKSNPSINGIIASLRDISQLKIAEKKMEHMAYTDSVTGIGNRRELEKILNEKISTIGTSFGLLFLDMKKFKFINDHLGHILGDKLIQAVAKKLLGSVSSNITVTRFGGDEFAMIIPLENAYLEYENIANVIRCIQQSFEQPIILDKYTLFVSLSIGCAIYPNDGSTIEQLMKNAAIALTRSKSEINTKCVFYVDEMRHQSEKIFSLMNDLQLALKNNEGLSIHYQPQINATSGKLIGFEALMRWNHPLLGYIQPSDFISAAEENGLIITLGEWVFAEVCKQVKKWSEQGWINPNVSVNFSAIQFLKSNFYNSIMDIIHKTGIRPEWIAIEITETAILKNEKLMISALKEFQKSGINISLDDFGVGYSSLSYINKINPDIIKIDKSFIDGIPNDSDKIKMVNIISIIATEFNKDLIAEGVETLEQVEYLRNIGCDNIQGYYFSKPLEANAAYDFLKKMLEFTNNDIYDSLEKM